MRKNLSLIIGSICIIYYLYLSIFFGGIAFDEFFLALGIILIIYNTIRNKIKLSNKRFKFLKVTTSIIVAFFILVESLLVFYPKDNLKDPCDYLIILGAAVKNNKPSLTLRGRLDKAIEYLNKTNDDCYIIVSGGKGQGETVSEAYAMKEYLVNNGVDNKLIIEENNSTSTEENLKYSREKIENHSNNKIQDLNIKVVTTDFHSYRSSILAKKNKYKNVTFYTSKSKSSFVPVYYTREFFAFIKMLIKSL